MKILVLPAMSTTGAKVIIRNTFGPVRSPLPLP
ncbi:hypothetical protein SAMN06295998_1342 [Primorskyibacter flagellatus]|uniref:Uncharacterized protein n=1 Tax=Primorskyibacter flagellatus TaxID=1387277 RepID=A0A1W2EMV2_9RHOB|nr:hypothetical protein SAMN06295998_1342 [Primorskyibacter flagellatus]